MEILHAIDRECRLNIDRFSKSVLVTWIELLPNYAERFFARQFIVREKANHQVLARLEALLHEAFGDECLARDGLPTVVDVAAALHLSPNYLSALLKNLTGKSTKEHIQDRRIEKAKEKLASGDASITEVAYQLGFEYPQSFSKAFKARTQLTPSAYRAAMN